MDWRLHGKQVHAGTGGRTVEAACPAVVFLHGSGLDHRFWQGYPEHFAARGYSALAPDLPGHGRSAGPPLQGVEDMAGWLHDLLCAAGAGPASLVGHSLGCLVALEFAARFPERAASLSCVASGLATPVNPQLLQAAELEPERAVAMLVAWGFAPPGELLDPSLPARVAASMQATGGVALAADLRACDGYRNGAAAAAVIRCPVQLVIGGRDRLAPPAATGALAAALRNPRVDHVDGSGHMVPLEMPGECRQALDSFISAHNALEP